MSTPPLTPWVEQAALRPNPQGGSGPMDTAENTARPAALTRHSLEDLPALAQQRLQVGVAQGPVEAVPVPLGLADGGEPFAELLWGTEEMWASVPTAAPSSPVTGGVPPAPGRMLPHLRLEALHSVPTLIPQK